MKTSGLGLLKIEPIWSNTFNKSLSIKIVVIVGTKQSFNFDLYTTFARLTLGAPLSYTKTVPNKSNNSSNTPRPCPITKQSTKGVLTALFKILFVGSVYSRNNYISSLV